MNGKHTNKALFLDRDGKGTGTSAAAMRSRMDAKSINTNEKPTLS